MSFPNLNDSIYIFRDISSPAGIFLSTVYACISLETALHFTVISAFLGLGQNPQGSETHVRCQNPWCHKQPDLISILKLPIKTCLMLQGAASPLTLKAQLTQGSVSKANPGSCCLAVLRFPSQTGTSCSHCCLCQQPPTGASTHGPMVPGHPHPVPLCQPASGALGHGFPLPAELQNKLVI